AVPAAPAGVRRRGPAFEYGRYVAMPGPKDEATAAGGRSCRLRSALGPYSILPHAVESGKEVQGAVQSARGGGARSRRATSGVAVWAGAGHAARTPTVVRNVRDGAGLEHRSA